MKISQKGPAGADLSQLVQQNKGVDPGRSEGHTEAAPSGASARVEISEKARKLQRIAELVRLGDQLRAAKVQQLKAQIDAGQYHVDAKEIAKNIMRSDVAELLGKR